MGRVKISYAFGDLDRAGAYCEEKIQYKIS